MAIPYAPSRSYVPDSSIIQLIQQAGHDAAQGQRQGGAIWGNAVRDIGGIAAGTIQDIAAAGGATWNAFASNNNVDAGNNSGWNFGLTPQYAYEYPIELRSFTERKRF